MKRNNIIVLLFAVLCANTLGAQQVLTIDSCLDLALKNNKALKEHKISEEKAKQVKMQVFTKYFPNISLVGAGYMTLDPVVKISDENIKDHDMRERLDNFYKNFGESYGLPNSISLFEKGMMGSVTAVQPIFMGGKIVAGNKLAKMGVQASELQTEVFVRDLLLDIEQNYWLIASLEDKVQTLQTVTQLLDTLHSIVSVAVEAGVAKKNDLLQVQLKQDEIKVKKIQLDNGIVLAKRNLCQNIGVEYNDSLQVDTLWYEDNEDISLPSADMVQTRPETEQLKLQLKAGKTKRYMEVAEALPKIAVMGSYYYGDIMGMNTEHLKSTYNANGVVGLTVTVPLTGWWEAGHKIKAQSLALQQNQLQYEDLTEKMLLQTYQTYDKLLETKAICTQQQTSLATAQENYRLYILNYQVGRASISELLEAQGMYLQASNNLTDAKINYLMAMKRYQALTK